jgi:hypothetical protein
MPQLTQPALRLNSNAHRLCRRNNTLAYSLQAQPTQSQLSLLNLRNLIDMLQTNRSHNLITTRTLQLPLLQFYPRRIQQQPTRCRSPDLEVKGSVGSDGYPGWDGNSGDHVCCAGVEFL